MMQFQMFLQQLIPAMEFGTALMTPLAVLLAILYSCDGGNLRKTFRKAAYWGFWGSVFMAEIQRSILRVIKDRAEAEAKLQS